MQRLWELVRDPGVDIFDPSGEDVWALYLFQCTIKYSVQILYVQINVLSHTLKCTHCYAQLAVVSGRALNARMSVASFLKGVNAAVESVLTTWNREIQNLSERMISRIVRPLQVMNSGWLQNASIQWRQVSMQVIGTQRMSMWCLLICVVDVFHCTVISWSGWVGFLSTRWRRWHFTNVCMTRTIATQTFAFHWEARRNEWETERRPPKSESFVRSCKSAPERAQC